MILAKRRRFHKRHARRGERRTRTECCQSGGSDPNARFNPTSSSFDPNAIDDRPPQGPQEDNFGSPSERFAATQRPAPRPDPNVTTPQQAREQAQRNRDNASATEAQKFLAQRKIERAREAEDKRLGTKTERLSQEEIDDGPEKKGSISDIVKPALHPVKDAADFTEKRAKEFAGTKAGKEFLDKGGKAVMIFNTAGEIATDIIAPESIPLRTLAKSKLEGESTKDALLDTAKSIPFAFAGKAGKIGNVVRAVGVGLAGEQLYSDIDQGKSAGESALNLGLNLGSLLPEGSSAGKEWKELSKAKKALRVAKEGSSISKDIKESTEEAIEIKKLQDETNRLNKLAEEDPSLKGLTANQINLKALGKVPEQIFKKRATLQKIRESIRINKGTDRVLSKDQDEQRKKFQFKPSKTLQKQLDQLDADDKLNEELRLKPDAYHNPTELKAIKSYHERNPDYVLPKRVEDQLAGRPTGRVKDEILFGIQQRAKERKANDIFRHRQEERSRIAQEARNKIENDKAQRILDQMRGYTPSQVNPIAPPIKPVVVPMPKPKPKEKETSITPSNQPKNKPVFGVSDSMKKHLEAKPKAVPTPTPPSPQPMHIGNFEVGRHNRSQPTFGRPAGFEVGRPRDAKTRVKPKPVKKIVIPPKVLKPTRTIKEVRERRNRIANYVAPSVNTQSVERVAPGFQGKVTRVRNTNTGVKLIDIDCSKLKGKKKQKCEKDKLKLMKK